MKKIVHVLMIVILVFLLSGCNTTGEDAKVTDTNGDGKLTCKLEVRCDTLLFHLDELKEDKAALVPDDGQLLEQREVEFSAGESVFDVFRKVLKEEKIHFEYTDAAIYNSVYIEGIGNLYEFDCGKQSGWMFSVNGTYPSLGCSSYTLADGDVVVFSYTCDLGADLGVSQDYEE